MDNRIHLHEEHTRDRGEHSDSSISEVNFRTLNPDTDFVSACLIYWEYWFSVMREDLAAEPSKGMKVLLVESHLNQFINKGYEIILAFAQDEPIGLLIHFPIFNAVTSISAFYVSPEYRYTKVGLGLIKETIFLKYSQIIFQSLNTRDNENDALRYTEGQRTLLHKDEKFSTWALKIEKELS